MTTDIQEWERQLQREITEIGHNGQLLAKAVAAVRGHGEVHGVFLKVDADGDITDLQIPQSSMHWTSRQLTTTLLDFHRKARADAKAKVKRLVSKADPRIHGQLQRLTSEQTREDRRRPPTEEEIQAANDAYFDRMNQQGWRT